MHIDFLTEQMLNATTQLYFRHLQEDYKIGERIFAYVNTRLENIGLIMHGGTIVGATIIVAQSSTKNSDKKRDTKIHQTPKGN